MWPEQIKRIYAPVQTENVPHAVIVFVQTPLQFRNCNLLLDVWDQLKLKVYISISQISGFVHWSVISTKTWLFIHFN